MGLGDGTMMVDDRLIYTAKDLQVGLYISIDDYDK